VRGGSRRARSRSDNAVFRRESFTRHGGRGVEPLGSCAADPLRPRLREPGHTVTRSDVLCRPGGAAPRIPGSRCGLVRRKRAHEHHWTRTDIHCAPVKERSAQQPRTPSIASSRPCGRANCPTKRLIALSDSPGTRFTIRGGLAMSRTESQRTASTAYLLRPRAKGSPMRDTLSRSLQPTSIHEHPLTSRLPSMALARF